MSMTSQTIYTVSIYKRSLDRLSNENVENPNLSDSNMEIDESITGYEEPGSSKENIKIKQELLELSKTAVESEMIKECTKTTDRTRRSRKVVEYVERRKSPSTSQKSLTFEAKNCLTASMKTQQDMSCRLRLKHLGKDDFNDGLVTRKSIRPEMNNSSTKANYIRDSYCWICHNNGDVVGCKSCIRVYHTKCLRRKVVSHGNWVCPECLLVLHAETSGIGVHSRKRIVVNNLSVILKFALKRMCEQRGAIHFLNPVNKLENQDYDDFIIHPMDLMKLENNINKNIYESVESFLADAKWILHNSIIYNPAQTRIHSVAKKIIKTCKEEIKDISACPECYYKAYSRDDDSWFVEPCSKPHLPLWAKLKGYPYWPAKAMSIKKNGMVAVHFFGKHDKSIIHHKDCFLYSLEEPNPPYKGKRNKITPCIEELKIYLQNVEKRFGEVHLAPFRTIYTVRNEMEIYASMLPRYNFTRNCPISIPFDEKYVENVAKKQLESFNKKKSVKSTIYEEENDHSNRPILYHQDKNTIAKTRNSSNTLSSVNTDTVYPNPFAFRNLLYTTENYNNVEYKDNKNIILPLLNPDTQSFLKEAPPTPTIKDFKPQSIKNSFPYKFDDSKSVCSSTNANNLSNTNSVSPVENNNNAYIQSTFNQSRPIIIEGVISERNMKTELPSTSGALLQLDISSPLKQEQTQTISDFFPDREINDFRNSYTAENSNLLPETKALMEKNILQSLDEANGKRWCATCMKPSHLYCCWNTSYCSYDCQTYHWAQEHFAKCAQQNNGESPHLLECRNMH